MTDRKIRLLLVEDDKVDQMAFERFARSENLPYDYAIAGSVAEAKEILKITSFDVIIADYMLGDGISFELFDSFKDLPVIVTTGTGTEEVAVEAMKLGACDYLIKDPEGNYLKTLPSTVELALKRKQTEKELQNYHERLESMVKERTAQLEVEIVERKRAEEQIKASLKEKETLFQEIHHRVKNNMQVISGLLSLQMRSTDDKNIKEALQDCQLRIQAMSLVHKTLYGSNNLSTINMKAYLSHLIDTISQSLVIDPSRVKINVEADEINLGVEQATPLGLIVNELVSNALKYAFPGNREGEITIKLQTADQDEIELTVADNGIGIHKDFNWQSTGGTGLNLVKLLAERQLDGAIELKRDQGTCFVTKFKLTN